MRAAAVQVLVEPDGPIAEQIRLWKQIQDNDDAAGETDAGDTAICVLIIVMMCADDDILN